MNNKKENSQENFNDGVANLAVGVILMGIFAPGVVGGVVGGMANAAGSIIGSVLGVVGQAIGALVAPFTPHIIGGLLIYGVGKYIAPTFTDKVVAKGSELVYDIMSNAFSSHTYDDYEQDIAGAHNNNHDDN